MKKARKQIFIVLISISVVSLFAFAYTQFVKKELISAVIQNEIDLSSPSENIYAITTFDQKLSSGKVLQKGTRFLGMLNKEENDFVINIEKIQTTSNKVEPAIGKANLNVKESPVGTGVSAKISKTLYRQTKSNVLGAIFTTGNEIKQGNSSNIPRGTTIKIEMQ